MCMFKWKSLLNGRRNIPKQENGKVALQHLSSMFLGKRTHNFIFSLNTVLHCKNVFYFIHWSTFKAKMRLCLLANSFCHLLLIGYWFIDQIFLCSGLKQTMPLPPTIILCHGFRNLLQVAFISVWWFCTCSTWLRAVAAVRGDYFQLEGDGDSVCLSFTAAYS